MNALLSVLLISLSAIGCSSDRTGQGFPEDTSSGTPAVESRTYYVSPNGNDGRSALEAQKESTPWRTIQKAADAIMGGDTVVILSGTYHERVVIGPRCSGTEKAPTLFVARDKDAVVIDDGHDGVSEQFASVFKIDNARHIKIEGIKIINSRWFGFSAENGCEYIEITSCSTDNTRASGIYVSNAVHVTITNNHIKKACQENERDSHGWGSQECITVTRTKNFKISGNEVWGSTVDGSAGGEGIDAKGGSCDGEISGNYIHDIVPLAIYVDAGSGESRNIRVFGNRAIDTGGFAIAGELGGYAHDIYFYNNVIVNSELSGFVFQNIMNGKFTDIYLVNNTFYNNNRTGGFGGDVGNYSTNPENRNLVIRNNVFYNRTGKHRFSIWHNEAAPHVVDHNLYYDFKASYSGVGNNFTQENLTAADVVDQDPMFVDGGAFDFRLLPSSPAIGRAEPVTLPGSSELLFDTDFSGNRRGSNQWDMGAFEYSED